MEGRGRRAEGGHWADDEGLWRTADGEKFLLRFSTAEVLQYFLISAFAFVNVFASLMYFGAWFHMCPASLVKLASVLFNLPPSSRSLIVPTKFVQKTSLRHYQCKVFY